MVRKCLSFFACAVGLVGAAAAQTSPNFGLTEHVLNGGGTPRDGVVMASTHYSISADSIAPLGAGEAGSCWRDGVECYQMAAGFVSSYPPPGEVFGITFDADHERLRWRREPSAGFYNLYRDALGELPGGRYGFCEQRVIEGESTIDPSWPPAGNGFFYLVTVRNRLDEEGTKGHDSSGAERPNPEPCP